MIECCARIIIFLRLTTIFNSILSFFNHAKTQKFSGMFKTQAGADTYCQIHSITQTAKKNNQNPFSVILFYCIFIRSKNAGLGTAFFSVLNAPFFSVLLKNATFFCILFLSFWRLMKPKRMMRSFAKNVK